MTRRTFAVMAVTFLVAASSFGQCPSAASAPVTQSPTGNIAANTTVTFSWTPSAASGVTGYDVLVSKNNSGSTIACSVTGAATSQCTVAGGFNAGGIYGWLVRARITGCTPGLDSSVKAFTAGCPTAIPGSQSPADGSTGVALTPTLQWSAVPNATAYEIFLGPVTTPGTACAGQAVGTSNTNSFHPSQLQTGTTYEWRVEAIGASGCPGVFSSCVKFTTTGTACTPAGAFSLVSPGNNATVTIDKPTFQWSASPGADKYFIHIGLLDPPPPQTSDPGVSAPTTSYTVGSSLPAGTYYWYVDSVPTCGGSGKTSSSVFKFTVATCANTAATLSSPSANATNVTSPVTFQWSGVSRASGYNLYVNDNLVTTTTDTKATATVPQDGSHVTWYVDTLSQGCSAIRSQSSTFTTATAAACPAGSITLTAPASNSTVSGDSQVSFSWTGINGATAYRLFVAMDGGSAVQLARTGNTNVSVALPNGSAEWYVEALFNSTAAANSCPSIVSPRGMFTVTTASNCSSHKAATLSSPLSGNATSPINFTWTVTDASTTLYRVWISVNGQPFDDVGVTTANHLTSEVGPGTVIWYVQSFFEGCPSLNSARATFTALSTTARCPSAAPVTLAPANNATIGSPVTFSWSAVSGADDYRLYVAKGSGEFEVLADDLDDTTVMLNLVPGSYTWFAEATFEECGSTRSARSKFTVNQAQNCPGVPPQLIAPAEGAAGVKSPVAFDWTDVADAIGYRVVIEHNEGSPTRLDETTASDTTKHLAPGTYEWWVVALFNGCPSMESAHHTFVVPDDPCNSKRPLLLLPPDNSDVVSPARFAWTRSDAGATYRVWASVDGSSFNVLGSTTGNTVSIPVTPGKVRWFVEAVPANAACSPIASSLNGFVAVPAPPCDRPARPAATVVGQAASGSPYSVRWTPIPNSVHYELEESATADFANATSQVVSDTSAEFTHAVTAVTRYHYRVRAVSSCSDEHGPYSRVVAVYILPAQRLTSVEFGNDTKTSQTVKLPGQTPPTTFSVHADKPWVTVTPSSGNIGPDGVTLTLSSDPSTLNLGTNTATLLVTYGGSGKTANAVSSGSIPISINLVTPVSPTGKNTPLPDSLIIPAVAHAPGANNSMFQSDVRIANVSATTQKYQLNFTLSGTDGTQSGQSTTIQIDPGKQMALDDILTTFFGNGSDGSGAGGMLEIRPLSGSSSSVSSSSGTVSVQTVASSKTYNVTSNGTFAQFIPAIPFSQFIAKAADGAAQPFISLQQIAQSSAYRTNFGLVEAAGEPADVIVHVIDNLGHELAALPIHLLAGEHQQLNSFLATNNINVTDGRIEVEVVSTTGKVSAYASVVDNLTNDPLLVFPVIKGAKTATRYTIPGVADLNNGFASWRSDLRIFNPGIAPTDVTLAYYPQGNGGGPTPKTVTVAPGQVYAIDNALQSLYNLTNSGGAIVVTTPSTSALTVTARTYNQTGSGTYGQFIPAVSPADSVGLGDRTLQVLQLESSSAYRTNIGLSETSGNPVTIELSVLPDQSKVAAKLTMDLAANEFRQISLADFNLGTIYNTRVSVKVTNGAGRVTAYGSVIDQITQDPTYVPAQ